MASKDWRRRWIVRDGKLVVSGAYVCELWTTYGLPMEITRDLARENGYEIDEVGFYAALEEHRQRSKREP
jgi:alanyl-tRNA synthetase